jgi:hypothetical protein
VLEKLFDDLGMKKVKHNVKARFCLLEVLCIVGVDDKCVGVV